MGKFELFKGGKAGKQWFFRLKARNGQIIATSEAYESEAGARNGIRSVRVNAPFARVVEVEK